MKKPTANRNRKRNRPDANRRVIGRLLAAVTLAFFVGVSCRFFYIATTGHADATNLKQTRETQQARSRVLKAKRGTIYDRNQSVLAEDSNAYTVTAMLTDKYAGGDKTQYVHDKKKTAKVLSQYLPLSQKKLLAYLNPKQKVDQVEFGAAGKGLTLSIKQQIEAEKLPGITFTDSPSRLYPNGVFASHMVGMVQADQATSENATLKGVMGLEKQFNSVLAGHNGTRSAATDLFGYALPNAKVKVEPAVDGGSVTTTIDTNLQAYLETLLTKVQTTYQPKVLGAILMDPKTGDILAASQRPTFDPITGSGLNDMWRNALVEDAYEPGSIMKIITLASAIQSHHYKPNQWYNSGSVMVSGSRISDWNPAGWGSIPLSQAFPRSSNVGMVMIEQAMGKATFKAGLERFGFGEKTGIKLPGETSGTVNVSTDLQAAITSFGQGIDVNAMQLMQAVTAIANRGNMMTPRLVKRVTTASGKVTTYAPKVAGKPVTKKTADTVVDAMRETVTAPYGTGQAYQMDGVDLAVKTGTAQLAGPKGYLTGDANYIFSVMGLAPAKNPKYQLYVMMQQPQKMTDPAETIMAAIFKPMMSRALAISGSIQAPVDKTTVTVANVTGKPRDTALTTLKAAGLNGAVVGLGNKVVQQLPAGAAEALPNERVVLMTNGAMTMPDVTGWAKGDVLKLAQLTGQTINLKGEGFASHQSLKPDALLSGDPITVTFSQKP